MINMANVSISRRRGEEEQPGKKVQDEAGKESDEEKILNDQIQSPSMLILACNVVEVLRLRAELIKIVHENDELAEVYAD